MENSVVLISVRPEYADKILSGEKKLEFRRQWAANKVKSLVIYTTSPVQQIVAVAQIGKVFRGSKDRLWELAKSGGGGISRRKLFKYMEGKQEGVAIELSRITKFSEGINPFMLFGDNFHPPQSFRYLSQVELNLLARPSAGCAQVLRDNGWRDVDSCDNNCDE